MKRNNWFTDYFIFTGFLIGETILMPYHELEKIYYRTKNNYKKYNEQKW